MTLTKELVAQMANLAQIRLDEQQTAHMIAGLNQMLDHMDILHTVDTEGIEPLYHTLPTTNATRPDVVTEPFARERLLANAPEATEEAFVVPKTVG